MKKKERERVRIKNAVLEAKRHGIGSSFIEWKRDMITRLRIKELDAEKVDGLIATLLVDIFVPLGILP